MYLGKPKILLNHVFMSMIILMLMMYGEFNIQNEGRYTSTWRSNHALPIFCILYNFLLSQNFISQKSECKIVPGYKSDHCLAKP